MKEMALQKIEIANHYLSYLIINEVWVGVANLGMQKIIKLDKEPQCVSSVKFAKETSLECVPLKQNNPEKLKKKMDYDFIGESSAWYFEKTIHAAVADYCKMVPDVKLDDLWYKYSKHNKIKEYFEETIIKNQPRTENKSKKLTSLLQHLYVCRYKCGLTVILFLHYITTSILPKFMSFFPNDNNKNNLYSHALFLFITKIIFAAGNNFCVNWIGTKKRGKPPRWYDIQHYLNQWKFFRLFIAEQISNFTLLQREPRYLSSIQELQKWFIYPSSSVNNTNYPSYNNTWTQTGEPIAWGLQCKYLKQQQQFGKTNWFSKYDFNHINIVLSYCNSQISFKQWNSFNPDTEFDNLTDLTDALVQHININQMHIISSKDDEILQKAVQKKKIKIDLFCGHGMATFEDRFRPSSQLEFTNLQPNNNNSPIQLSPLHTNNNNSPIQLSPLHTNNFNSPIQSSPLHINNFNSSLQSSVAHMVSSSSTVPPQSYQQHIDTQIEWINELKSIEQQMEASRSVSLCCYTVPQIMEDIERLHNELVIEEREKLSDQICDSIKSQPSFWTQAQGNNIYCICYLNNTKMICFQRIVVMLLRHQQIYIKIGYNY